MSAEPAIPAGSGHPSRWRRGAPMAGGALFALTPWLSLGFATPIAFILAAALFSHLGKVHTVVLWLSATVHTAALIVALTHADAASGTTGDHLFVFCMLITIVGGGLQALAFTVVAAVNGYRPGLGRTTRNVPTEATPEVRPRTRSSRVVTMLGMIFVAALFPALLFILINDASFQRHHQDAQATIVSVRVDPRCSGWPAPTCNDQYYPTVRFTTRREEVVQAETSDSGADDTWTMRKGKAIAVHYDPSDPGNDVRLGSGWGGDDILIIVLMLIIYGSLGFVAVRSRRRHEPTS